MVTMNYTHHGNIISMFRNRLPTAKEARLQREVENDFNSASLEVF